MDNQLPWVSASFVGQGRLRNRPSCVFLAYQLVVGYEHLVEEHLVEFRIVGYLAERPDLDPGRTHVDHEDGDALPFRQPGSSPGQTQPPVGELRVGGPNLLASECPTSVDPGGHSGHGGQVAAGIGLAEQLAEEPVGRENVGQPSSLLVLRPVGEKGGSDQVDSDSAYQFRCPCPSQFLLHDEVVEWFEAPAPVLQWPRHADHSGAGQFLLPVPQERHFFAQVVEHGWETNPVLPGQFAFEPTSALRPEFLLARSWSEIHPVRSTSSDPGDATLRGGRRLPYDARRSWTSTSLPTKLPYVMQRLGSLTTDAPAATSGRQPTTAGLTPPCGP